MASGKHGNFWTFVVVGALAAGLTWNFLFGPPNVSSDPDAQFCWDVFNDLARGKERAAEHIDWERFRAIGVDVGASYLHFKEEDRDNYRKMFIMSFAHGFRQSGARPNSFRNWRVLERDGELAIVAADHTSNTKTLLLTVNALEPKRLVGMEWQQPG